MIHKIKNPVISNSYPKNLDIFVALDPLNVLRIRILLQFINLIANAFEKLSFIYGFKKFKRSFL